MLTQPRQLPQEVTELLTPRLKDEYTAHYSYRAISNWYRNKGFNLAADYFEKEAEDELIHAKKLQDYFVGWNTTPPLQPIDQPELNFETFFDPLNLYYKLETELYDAYIEDSGKIFDMGELATYDFLQFFREIQNSSVIEASDLINVAEGAEGSSKVQLLQLEEIMFGD